MLSGTFFLLTIWAYIRYARRPGLKRYPLVILTMALGLMAKSMLVTLPFVLLLMDYWPLGRTRFGGPAGTGWGMFRSSPIAQTSGFS